MDQLEQVIRRVAGTTAQRGQPERSRWVVVILYYSFARLQMGKAARW